MRKGAILTLFILLALVFTLTFTVGAASPKAATAPVAAVPAAPMAAPVPPPHPRVHEAIDALRSARDHMAHAEGEFHGHRDKTIEHIDAAIQEAEICLQEP